jgi:hypothetical protein
MSRIVLNCAVILSSIAIGALLMALNIVVPSLEPTYAKYYVEQLGGMPYPLFFLATVRQLPQWLLMGLMPSIVILIKAHRSPVTETYGLYIMAISINFAFGILIIGWYFLILTIPFTNTFATPLGCR